MVLKASANFVKSFKEDKQSENKHLVEHFILIWNVKVFAFVRSSKKAIKNKAIYKFRNRMDFLLS